MACITEEFARKQSDYMLERMAASGACTKCAVEAQAEITRRRIAKFYNCPYHILFGVKEMKNEDKNPSRSEGQHVSSKPKVHTSHDLRFLIRDKAGESTPLVVKDIDSKTLHDMLDIADEIVISRVDAQ